MKAKDLLKRSIIVDGLFHTLLGNPPPEGNTIIDCLLHGGVTAINTSVLFDQYKNDFKTFCKELYQYYVLEDTLPEKVIIAKSVKDIEKAKTENKLAVILGIQGADAIELDFRYISILHKLGIRIIQITYNSKNNLGCGAYAPKDTGLTRFGQQAVQEMNRLGILVDLSHVGENTSLEAIELSKKPCVFSHSSVKKLNKHKRNVNDEQIKAVAKKGGVIGLCPHSVMCMKEAGKRPNVNDYIDHIIYVIELAGEDAVGIGTDRWMSPTLAYQMTRNDFERTLPGFFGSFDGNQKHVEGFNHYDDWGNLTETMLKRGLTESQIVKVLGGNFLRVFNEVWMQ